MASDEEVSYRPAASSSDVPTVKLWGSCRLVVVILCNLGLFFIMYLRFNLSVAIVCMTQQEISTEDSYNATSVTTNVRKLLNKLLPMM